MLCGYVNTHPREVIVNGGKYMHVSIPLIDANTQVVQNIHSIAGGNSRNAFISWLILLKSGRTTFSSYKNSNYIVTPTSYHALRAVCRKGPHSSVTTAPPVDVRTRQDVRSGQTGRRPGPDTRGLSTGQWWT